MAKGFKFQTAFTIVHRIDRGEKRSLKKSLSNQYLNTNYVVVNDITSYHMADKQASIV